MKKTKLYQEIIEQPKILKRFLHNESNHIQKVINSVSGRFKYILIAARGSSDNAARYAQYIFGIQDGFQVALATPSIYTLYNTSTQINDALVIGISQSGQSPDICTVIKKARQQGSPTIAITNDRSSPLALLSDYVIDLQAGAERSIAATKTYTASLCALAMLSCHFLQDERLFDQLISLPSILESTITSTLADLDRIVQYRYIEHCVVIGRGYNYATAFEISLKIKELTGIIAEPYSSADFLHGPIATIHEGFPVIIVAAKGFAEKDLMNIFRKMVDLRAEVILITNTSRKSDSATTFKFSVSVPEHLSPIAAIIPGQLLSLKLALEKGIDPDHPFGLTKVTRTI